MNKLIALSLLTTAGLTQTYSIQDFQTVMASATEERPAQDSIYEHDLELIDWYVSFVRGSWFGFYKGMYHERQKPNSKCLSSQIHVHVHEIMQFLAYGELNQIFQLADSTSSIYFDQKNNCDFKELWHKVEEHCNQQNRDLDYNCSFKVISQNVTKKHLMEIGASVGMLGEDFKEFRADLSEMDSKDIYESTLNIGKQVGNLVAKSIDF